MPSKPRLQVVIVSYNVHLYAAQTIRSVLRAAVHLPVELWVVDNASTDGSVEFLSERFPDIHIIYNKENVGFSRANNQAIRQSETDYVLLLNPDTIISEDTLVRAVEFMDSHPDAGAAGVCMQDSVGRFARESRRALPTPWVSFLKMLGFSSRYYMGHLPIDRDCQIEVMSGAFMLLRREALNRVGLLDERFFMYGEDIDISYRMMLGGWKNYYLPLHIMHYKGESTQKSSFRYVHVFYDAMLIFYNKHFARRYRLLTQVIRLAVVLRGALDYVRHKLLSFGGHVIMSVHNDTDRFLVQVSPDRLADVEEMLQRNKLSYSTQCAEHEKYSYLLVDSSMSYADMLSLSRQTPRLLLAIYDIDERHILTSSDVWK